MRKQTNVISRATRLMFAMFVVYIFIIGSEISLSYNYDKAQKTIWDHIIKTVKMGTAIAKEVKPLF